MASNVLTGVVQITAPGVEATFQKIAASTKAMEAGLGKLQVQVAGFGGGVQRFTSAFQPIPVAVNTANTAIGKMPATTSAATQSLINLSRVAQDAPYGFIGIANNLNPLLESFQRLKVATGTTGGALSALKKELTGAGGIGLALGIVSSLLISFGDQLFGTTKRLTEAELAAAKFSAAITQLGDDLDETKRKLDLSAELQKLNLQLQGLSGVKLDIGELNIDKETNLRFIDSATKTLEVLQKQKDNFDGYRKAVLAAGDAAKSFGAKEGALGQILRNFPDVSKIPESALSKLTTREAAALGQYQTVVKKFADTKLQLEKALAQDVKLGKQVAIKNLPEVTTPVKVKVDKVDFDFAPIGKKLQIPISPEFTINFDDVRTVLLGGDLQTLQERAQENINNNIEKLAKPLKLNLSVEVTANNIKTEEFRKSIQSTIDSLNSAIAELAANSISSIAEGLGTALATGDLAKGFQAFADVVANGFIAIGKQMIAAAPIIKALKAAIDTLNPAILLPAGIALVAIGAALKASVSVKAREKGGPVDSGETYLVGEKGPELFTPKKSGRIIPHNETNRIFSNKESSFKNVSKSIQKKSNVFNRDSVFSNSVTGNKSATSISSALTNKSTSLISSILSNKNTVLSKSVFSTVAEKIKSIPARLFGGSVIAGTTYLAGERGAELFTPNTGSNIFGANVAGGSGAASRGGIAVQVTGEFLQRGQDLLAVITLANQSKLRLQ